MQFGYKRDVCSFIDYIHTVISIQERSKVITNYNMYNKLVSIRAIVFVFQL